MPEGQINKKLNIAQGAYLRDTAARRGHVSQRPIDAEVAKKATHKVAPTADAASAKVTTTVAATDVQPDGFGVQVNWTGSDDLALVAVINTADEYGLCVSGVRDGDTFEHISAVGHASFSTKTKNNGIAGLIGVVGVGADLAASAFGFPEAIPLINAATAYAQQQFPESEQPAKRRNVYGEDDSGGKARQEGGVIVCEPRARGIYGSGNADHQDRWIQPDGTRVDENLPKHIPLREAFFLRRELTTRRLHGNGDLFLSAWDHAFPDNAGSYRVHFILRRGSDQDTTTQIG